jgi:hypothetical protein
MLSNHNINYSQLEKQTKIRVQSSRLIRIENYRDSLYARYADRRIVRSEPII